MVLSLQAQSKGTTSGKKAATKISVPEGYVDLGLPSGTLWKEENEKDYYSFDDAKYLFDGMVPSYSQWTELKDFCTWKWTGNGYEVVGPNGNHLILPAMGWGYGLADINGVGSKGLYWSSNLAVHDAGYVWWIEFREGSVKMNRSTKVGYKSVRLVKKTASVEKYLSTTKMVPTGYVDLGLPSGTLWRSQNELDYYTYDNAVNLFGDRLPTPEQWKELVEKCRWEVMDGVGSRTCVLIGPNGNMINIPVDGFYEGGRFGGMGKVGSYWSSATAGGDNAICRTLSRNVGYDYFKEDQRSRNNRYSIRLVYTRDKSKPAATTNEKTNKSAPKSGMNKSTTTATKSKETEKKEDKKTTVPPGYVDLGLPSGTLWGPGGGFKEYDDAVKLYGNRLPTKEQWAELMEYCRWEREAGSGYKVYGPDGKSIFLPMCYIDCREKKQWDCGVFWSSTFENCIYVHPDNVGFYKDYSHCNRFNVVLVYDNSKIKPNTSSNSKDNPLAIKKRKSEYTTTIPEGYVDLGLPSKTLWKIQNEEGYYSYDDALSQFGFELPTSEQLNELRQKCSWTWTGNGYKVTGPNGNSINMPAMGFRNNKKIVIDMGAVGWYWTFNYWNSEDADFLSFNSKEITGGYTGRSHAYSVRLIKNHNKIILPTTEPKESVKKEDMSMPKGYVDLGLPSGTLWNSQNERDMWTYDDAVKRFGNRLPSKEQWEELKDKCQWKWTDQGYKVIGPNGNYIFLTADGRIDRYGKLWEAGVHAKYLSSTKGYWTLDFNWAGNVFMNSGTPVGYKVSVRLVQNK